MPKILYLAETGSGKTFALRKLDPKTTFIINCDGKDPSFGGWSSKFRTVVNTDGKIDYDRTNYIELADPATIIKVLQKTEALDRIKTIIIDTVTHMITEDYMENALGKKDFGAYQDIGKNFYDIISIVRSSKKSYVLNGHIKKRITDMGEVVYEMSAKGKMIQELVPPSYFTTVLVGEVTVDGQTRSYHVRTLTNGNDPAKNPAKELPDGTIINALDYKEPNDIVYIMNKLTEFENNEHKEAAEQQL